LMLSCSASRWRRAKVRNARKLTTTRQTAKANRRTARPQNTSGCDCRVIAAARPRTRLIPPDATHRQLRITRTIPQQKRAMVLVHASATLFALMIGPLAPVRDSTVWKRDKQRNPRESLESQSVGQRSGVSRLQIWTQLKPSGRQPARNRQNLTFCAISWLCSLRR
jgi:hypothetical protein